MTLAVLKVAVVGHTNTGKTSLMRTLMRDVNFGEVSDRPATTRHVEGAALLINGRPVIELYDTPGLEDSSALLDHLDDLRQALGDRRIDNVELINRFLASKHAHGRFAQEAKALRQVLASDIALYVIDARDRVLGKHRDELEILSRCARPVVPVLNFTVSPEAQIDVWREHLSRANMHAVAEFDTVVLDESSERRLLEKMRTLLDRHQATLDALIDDRRQQRASLIRASAAIGADLLIDVAAHSVAVPAAEETRARQAMDELRDRVRRREQQCVEQLLELHRFNPADCAPDDLPLTNGQWGVDLFSPAAMKQFGIHTGSAAAAGAMIGLTIDAMAHGMSLGAATAIGAAIGALVGAGRTHGKRFLDRMRGQFELRCDDNTLRLLMVRQAALIDALLRRGHASVNPIDLSGPSPAGQQRTLAAPRRLPPELDEARIRPQWSRMNEASTAISRAAPSRRAAQDRLTDEVLKLLTTNSGRARNG